MIALLLAAAAPQTVIDAERAFAAAAARDGQWTAFRAYADADATMFAPGPVKAQEWLKGRADPARAVAWSPTASYVSCDGLMAVNTGEWRRADGSVGYFTTVWAKRAGGSWRWVLDHGDALTKPRSIVARPATRHASCAGDPSRQSPPFLQYRWGGLQGGGRYVTNATLRYSWHVESKFDRDVQIALWTGKRWQLVINDDVPAPTP